MEDVVVKISNHAPEIPGVIKINDSFYVVEK